MPQQEPGTRPARPLPYLLYTHGRLDPVEGKFHIEFQNQGQAGAAFYARNGRLPNLAPRRYSISAAHSLTDYWLISDNDSNRTPAGHPDPSPELSEPVPDYDLALHGPQRLLQPLPRHCPCAARLQPRAAQDPPAPTRSRSNRPL